MLNKRVLLIVSLIFVWLLASCGSPPVENPAVVVDENTQIEANNDAVNTSEENQPAEDTAPEPTIEPTLEPAEPEFTPLPAERQAVVITTSDGRALEGYYYPAKVPDAPVVVLMHWAVGTMDDWLEIAPWLQNRQDELAIFTPGYKAAKPFSQDDILIWLDATWFPEMPAEVSFAVVVFNFGDFGGSAYGGSRQSWLDDAYSAMEFAAGLDGVDPHQVSVLGASIGADGSVDSCYLMNMNSEVGSCVGALSLSPGNYLTEEFTYTQAADAVDLDGFPVWCLAAEGDYESPSLCRSLTGKHAEAFIYSGSDHGMALVDPAQTPSEPALDLNAMQLIQAWLDAVYGTTIEDAYN